MKFTEQDVQKVKVDPNYIYHLFLKGLEERERNVRKITTTFDKAPLKEELCQSIFDAYKDAYADGLEEAIGTLKIALDIRDKIHERTRTS